jgi:hypothetical protein
MKLFAQQGYGKGDKIHTSLNSSNLDGIVLSPRDEKIEKLKDLVNEINTGYGCDLYFDPQFYYALYIDATSKNLDDYPYYPGHIKLSSLRSFKKINSFSKQCIDFQLDLGLTSIVSPNILIPNFSDRNAQIALNFAEESIELIPDGVDHYVSLIFSESALNEYRNVNDFLNELSTLDVTGFYITVDRKGSQYSQDFESHSTLVNLLTLIYSLSEINEFKVIMSYSDIIGLLYFTVGAHGVANGWFNSSRRFTVGQRVLPSKGGRLPRERYTSIPLLNSILISELDSIYSRTKSTTTNFKDFLSNSTYEHLITSGPTPSDAWSRGISHLQHWSAIKNATTKIFTDPSDISQRLDDMEKHIKLALMNYETLEKLSVQLEKPSKGQHLVTWKEAIKEFREIHHV